MIGFVLSTGFEAVVCRTVQFYGFSILDTTQSQVLVVLILLSLYAGYRSMRREWSSGELATRLPHPSSTSYPSRTTGHHLSPKLLA